MRGLAEGQINKEVVRNNERPCCPRPGGSDLACIFRFMIK